VISEKWNLPVINGISNSMELQIMKNNEYRL